MKPNISHFTQNTVHFVDGTMETIDAVFMCTGYKFGFPFLQEDIVRVDENKVSLYKYMFPPHLEKQTLAVIGCFQSAGSLLPVAEIQCRLATKVFKVSGIDFRCCFCLKHYVLVFKILFNIPIGFILFLYKLGPCIS